MPPPNILFIFTDQQSASAMSGAGNRDLNTPAMDSLATAGARFTRAYCTFPLCTPSRLSLMTGVMPHRAGCAGNNVAIPEHLRERSLGRLFDAAGYECAYGGKWHLPGAEVAEGYGFRKISGFNDHDLAPACAAFLHRQHDRPFLLVASFDNPHNICEWARGDPLPWGPIESAGDEARLPALPANFAIAADAPEALAIERAANPRVHPTMAKVDSWWRQYRYAYYRLVERVDAQIGLILAALRDAGLEKNTLVVFSSDHGDGQGEHHWNQKSALDESCINIPLILKLPGRIRAGLTNGTHLVSNGLDLLPTLCDYAGVVPPPGLEGRSLRTLAECGDDPGWRQELTIETCFAPPAYRGTTGRALVTRRHKFAAYSQGQHREQLFELQDDPGETRNLVNHPSHSRVLDDMRRRLTTQ